MSCTWLSWKFDWVFACGVFVHVCISLSESVCLSVMYECMCGS